HVPKHVERHCRLRYFSAERRFRETERPKAPTPKGRLSTADRSLAERRSRQCRLVHPGGHRPAQAARVAGHEEWNDKLGHGLLSIACPPDQPHASSSTEDRRQRFSWKRRRGRDHPSTQIAA